MYARDHALIATPIGTVAVEGDDAQVAAVRIGEAGPVTKGSAAAVRTAIEQLEQWFAGERRVFDVAMAAPATLRGAELRDGLVAVGYGETLSYGTLARTLRSSPRAIGQLCARNPFPILVPCHRILGSGGALGAYSAGDGPKTKSWLVEHERQHSRRTLL
ncbi:methylated-DNA--[protein]-cysteine S-methyltransferase [Sphingomonas sp. M1-B02]|uniref:methylated-DNA--[protein]-cysteine S-methyltransferase n=1 Tax=Sphingomonas sp. M1-B02 TaxID=3114300 RepID=UPI002240A7C0|nr:methylated-DNA--[protein]-cysteine S-methyltransferase [Sphingomonas sp. S6-11]UZK65226.1 methylated-DNA--[protein]-cysteine S-methyltransferase [Sphingomonas sp. S6-11]